MNAYKFSKIPELTKEEKKSPYARFYDEPILPPAPEVVAAIQPGKQINPSLVLAPQDMPKLIMPGTLKADNGYCVLPDGTGFSVIHTKAPGITLEMEKWWNEWITSSDYNYLNFKIGLPSLHFMYANPTWEDLGWGPASVYMSKTLKPMDLSAWPKELNPDFLTMYSYDITITLDFGGKPYWANVAHYITLGKRGEDIITCIWNGIHNSDGTPVRMINKSEQVDPEYVRLLACHYAWELARKAQLLPKLYAYSKKLKA
jgi:phloretin hydrolase